MNRCHDWVGLSVKNGKGHERKLAQEMFPKNNTAFPPIDFKCFLSTQSKLVWNGVMSQAPLMSPLNSGDYSCLIFEYGGPRKSFPCDTVTESHVTEPS